MAGVALGDVHLRFAWQAWHLATCAFVSRGRRGTWRHLPAFYVAGVALGDIYPRFTWQAWHLRHWASSCGALGLGLVAGEAAALCMAGVALGDMCLCFTWQAWHLATSTFVSRGRRGTYGTGLALVAGLGCGTWRHLPVFHVAGVALTALG